MAKAEMQDAVTEDLIGENRLWTAVLVKAVEDWTFGTIRRDGTRSSFYLNMIRTSTRFARMRIWIR